MKILKIHGPKVKYNLKPVDLFIIKDFTMIFIINGGQQDTKIIRNVRKSDLFFM